MEHENFTQKKKEKMEHGKNQKIPYKHKTSKSMVHQDYGMILLQNYHPLLFVQSPAQRSLMGHLHPIKSSWISIHNFNLQ